MAGLLERVGKWFDAQQDRQYLSGLSGVELMDAGFSRSDFMTAMAAPPDTRDRMVLMAAAHGLPADALDTEHWRAMDIARACGQCRERATCKRWLNGLEDGVEPSEFCPNSDHYAEMALSYGVKKAAGTQ